MTSEHGRYIAYLLRLWQSRSEGRIVWHASLENPHTGERQGFSDLESLYTFLNEELRKRDDKPPEGGATKQ